MANRNKDIVEQARQLRQQIEELEKIAKLARGTKRDLKPARRFAELLEETGARDNRIKGVLMRLQREGVRVVDVAPAGTGKALWFIPSPDVAKKIVDAFATHRRP